MMCCCLAARAQKMPVVADMDTRVPIAGVVVSTNNGQRVVTDYTGRFHTQLPFSRQRNGFEEALYATPRERYRTTARHIVPYSARGGA